MHTRSSCRIAIRSTGPTYQWIRNFLKGIRRRSDGSVRLDEIADFDRIHRRIMRHERCARFDLASKAYDSAESAAEAVYTLLIHPRHYKHFLRSVARLMDEVRSDPRVIVVYDFRGLAHEVSHRSSVSLMEMTNLLWLLRDTFGETRVLERTQALDHAIAVLRSPRPVQQEQVQPVRRTPLGFLEMLRSSFFPQRT